MNTENVAIEPNATSADNEVESTSEPDFLDGKSACDLSGEGACEACQ